METRADDELSTAERGRAARFRNLRDGSRYASARLALRTLLAGYTGSRVRDITIVEGAAAKPRASGAQGLNFNVSHSGDLCLIAFGRTVELGIDVEILREIPDAATLAARHFTVMEREELHFAPGSSTFLTCWTRKEALVKHAGTGLHDRLADIHVGATPAAAIRANVRIVSFVPREDAIAGLAVDAAATTVRYFEYGGGA